MSPHIMEHWPPISRHVCNHEHAYSSVLTNRGRLSMAWVDWRAGGAGDWPGRNQKCHLPSDEFLRQAVCQRCWTCLTEINCLLCVQDGHGIVRVLQSQLEPTVCLECSTGERAGLTHSLCIGRCPVSTLEVSRTVMIWK